ncbi:MAG: hypothetical protein PHX18_02630 [Candidatus Gastranaerophilales bacterium]|nr:hypothetical protein [Candidatus Gastranaerophilales bacterium]
MKKFSAILIILLMPLFFCGCSEKNQIYLSSKPLTKEQFVPEDMLKVNQPINFVLIFPKGIKSDAIRLQLLKKSAMSYMWGYTIERGKDYSVPPGKSYLTGTFYVYEPGRYMIRMFSHSDFVRPLAEFDFGVLDE